MTSPTNIRDPDIPVTLGAFRALQDEVRRLDALARHIGDYVLYVEPDGRLHCQGLGVLPAEVAAVLLPFVDEKVRHA